MYIFHYATYTDQKSKEVSEPHHVFSEIPIEYNISLTTNWQIPYSHLNKMVTRFVGSDAASNKL